jgi:hypothetical protein
MNTTTAPQTLRVEQSAPTFTESFARDKIAHKRRELYLAEFEAGKLQKEIKELEAFLAKRKS